MRRPLDRLLPLLVILGLPTALGAQTTTLDEGSFRFFLAGREIGTETFNIRQSGTGDDAVIIAQGSVVVDTAGAPQDGASRDHRSAPPPTTSRCAARTASASSGASSADGSAH